MGSERRIFEREQVNIPFIYTLDEVDSLTEGDWFESKTIDIGPVLVGGLAFHSEQKVAIGDPIRIALFMDLELRKSWQPENETFPIYKGKVCRLTQDEGGQRIAVAFKGFGRKMEDALDSLDMEDYPSE